MLAAFIKNSINFFIHIFIHKDCSSMNMWQNIFQRRQIFCPRHQKIFFKYFVDLGIIFKKRFSLVHLLMLTYSLSRSQVHEITSLFQRSGCMQQFHSNDALDFNEVCHLLVLDVNDLLCQVAHVKFENKWKPQIHAMKCANKLVSPRPNHHQFLELCLSQFDIGMVNNDIAKPKTNNSIFVGGIVLWFIPLLSKHTTSMTQFDKFIVDNNFLYFDLLFRYSTLGFI